jgi:integrase
MVSQNLGKRRKSKLPKSLRPQDFIELVQSIPREDEISRTAFLLGYGAGLRVSEVPALKKHNITERILIEDAKGGKDRVVPLPKGWKQWMTSLLPIKISERSLQRRFKRYSKKAKLNPDFTFHSLRHGFATRLLQSGVPINQVQILMGHSDISTTGVYLRANPEDALKSYEEMF